MTDPQATEADAASMTRNKFQTYSGYLRLDELLSLQTPRATEADGGHQHDEMLFIIIHQVYELWFKQLLHELDFACGRMEAGDLPRLLHTMKRVLTILKVQVGQLDILETLRPLDFLAFRQRLDEASGLQSFQFRELEFVLGYKRKGLLARYPAGSEARRRLEDRLARPSLWAVFLRLLHGRGYEIPEDVLVRDVAAPSEPSPAVQAALIRLYHEDADLLPLCERLVDLDEGLQEWRYRHVKMVERTIGTRPGTGRTAGAAYLRTSLNRPIFPDLWTIRAEL